MGEEALNDLDTIRRALMRESPRQPVSVSVSVRRALAFYASHLNRIGEEKLAAEFKRAIAGTYAERNAAEVCGVK
jgi:hypothetical protein